MPDPWTVMLAVGCSVLSSGVRVRVRARARVRVTVRRVRVSLMVR